MHILTHTRKNKCVLSGKEKKVKQPRLPFKAQTGQMDSNSVKLHCYRAANMTSSLYVLSPACANLLTSGPPQPQEQT